MPFSLQEAHQKILAIYENIDRNSQFYGRLVNWYEGIAWHYGIALKDNLIFDTGGFSIFERNSNEFFQVPDCQIYTPDETIERLCYSLVCFREWNYGLLGWNCEHLARLIASDMPISYEVKKCPFPIPQMNHDGWHPSAKDIFQKFIDENPNLISEIFFICGQKSLDNQDLIKQF
ncbi:MAG: hypothetical protein VKJ02_07565 [Snowella sp.]|nr:hypothetical protein [Snowella sp.]